MAPALASVLGTTGRSHHRDGALQSAVSISDGRPIRLSEVCSMKKSRRVTMLELVQLVQDTARSDEEVVALITHMINTRRVVLSGTFADKRLATALAV
ncbi:MAG TPA: hypothetical protein VN812_05850 [Candidatus Acidoferrales bacterium]|nr:hypothetical protein [Candidatus Acidoferrales bacterium]